MKTKLFTLLLAVSAGVGTMFAESGTCGNNLTWDLTDSVLTISGTGAMNNYRANSAPWYSYSSSITSAIVENGVTSIGSRAFMNCWRLTSVTIPNSVTYIGYRAFDNCTALPVIDNLRYADTYLVGAVDNTLSTYTIKDGTRFIGDDAFSGCRVLTSIAIPNSVIGVGTHAFDNCTALPVIDNLRYADTYLVGAVDNTLSTYTIKDGTRFIGWQAFSGCTGLTSVTIPNSVTSIGWYAFSGCSGLTSVTIPNSVTSIGCSAFSGCSSLTKVNITDIASWCNILFEDYEGSPWSCAHHLYIDDVEVTELVVPSSITSIGWQAFSGCTGLTSVKIPEGVTCIGGSAFSGCTDLTSVAIGNSVISIGAMAFYNCTSLKTITCDAQTPSVLGNLVFYYSTWTSYPMSNIKIYVPCGTLETYQTAEGWSEYASQIKYALLPYKISTIAENGNVITTDVTTITICEPFVTCTAIANYGYHFAKWSDGNIENPRVIELTQDTTFTAEFAKNTYTISTESANPEWGTTAGDTAALYLDEVEISAAPNYGYHFTKWDIEKYQESIEYGTLHIVKFSVQDTWSNPYAWIWETEGWGHWETLSYEDGMYVYRTTQNNMNIIVVPNGPDWGSGQTNDLAITESCCYTISGEYDVNNRYVTIKNYNCFSTDEQTIIDKLDTITYVDTTITTYTTNPLSLLVAQNQKAIAYFAKNVYSITKNAAHGSISGNSSAEYLDEVTLSVSSDYGYHFAQWSDGNTDNPRTIVLTQDTTFTAEFAKNSYTISTTSANLELGTTSGDTTALYLDEVEISAIPNYGYRFVRWDDNNTSNPRTVIVTEDKTYTATFAKDIFYITTNAEHGSISGNSSAEYLDFVTLTVNADYGYHFTQWSDGLKDNPRIFQITKDTTFTAEFAYDRVGTCGKDMALIWSYDPANKVLTIGNAGEFTENMRFGVEAPTEMRELVVGNNVTAIGAGAFAGIKTLSKVTVGDAVKTIGEQAFYDCTGLTHITCYRERPCVAYSNTFDGIDKFDCTLHVLSSSVDMYKSATGWRDFYYIETIDAATTTLSSDDVTVEPSVNTATVTWPTQDNAATYTIQITKDGEVFCTLIFNSNGQLTGIAFAPSRNGTPHAPAAIKTANGLQFTVTGLNSNTQYGYSVTAKDSNDDTIVSYSGEFTTTGETQGIEDISFSLQGGDRGRLILRNGQIFILRGDKTYTLTGQKVQ